MGCTYSADSPVCPSDEDNFTFLRQLRVLEGINRIIHFMYICWCEMVSVVQTICVGQKLLLCLWGAQFADHEIIRRGGGHGVLLYAHLSLILRGFD